MRTIFGIATSSGKLNSLLANLEANSVPMRDITVVMPGDPGHAVPPEAADAEAVGDDFSGNPKRAVMGGAIGALLGIGVLAISLVPGLIAIGAGAAALSTVVSGGAGGALGALLGLGIGDAKIAHYESRLKNGARLIAVQIPPASADDFVGLFEREGMEDIAVSRDVAVLPAG